MIEGRTVSVRISKTDIAKFDFRNIFDKSVAIWARRGLHELHVVGSVDKVGVDAGDVVEKANDASVELRKEVANGKELTNIELAIDNLLCDEGEDGIVDDVFESVRANVWPEKGAAVGDVLLLAAAARFNHAIDEVALEVVDFDFERRVGVGNFVLYGVGDAAIFCVFAPVFLLFSG